MPTLTKLLDWTLPASQESKQAALRRKILGWVNDGTLGNGERLPSIRQLADNLGVAKGTVAEVYQELAAEGYLAAKTGSGYTVSRTAAKPMATLSVESTSPLPPLNRQAAIAARVVARFQPHSEKPLACRCPVMDLFPEKEWKAISARLSRSPWRHTGYADPQGFLPLRKAIQGNLDKYRGISVNPAEIVITSGTVNALFLLAHVLFEPGQTIALESPVNPLFADIFRYVGLKILWLKGDSEGAVLPTQPVNGVLLTPSFSVPLGLRMSTQRRREWLRYVLQHRIWLIENDFDAEFSVTTNNVPALRALLPAGRNVIYIGTFSSIMFPGMKTGYIAAPNEVTTALTGLRQLSDRFTDESRQAALNEFIVSGEYERHLRKVSRLFDDRRRFILNELVPRILPYGRVISAAGGSHVTVKLNPNLPDQTVVQHLRTSGVVTRACSTFAGDYPCNGLMLGFGTFTETQIHDAVEILLRELARLN